RNEMLINVYRHHTLELQRDSEALLLLIPESGGRGRGVLTGKIFEYLAAERPILAAVPPDGAAAKLVHDTGAGVVVPSADEGALREALLDLHRRWKAGSLDGTPLSDEWRKRLSRGQPVEDLAYLLRSLAGRPPR